MIKQKENNTFSALKGTIKSLVCGHLLFLIECHFDINTCVNWSLLFNFKILKNAKCWDSSRRPLLLHHVESTREKECNRCWGNFCWQKNVIKIYLFWNWIRFQSLNLLYTFKYALIICVNNLTLHDNQKLGVIYIKKLLQNYLFRYQNNFNLIYPIFQTYNLLSSTLQSANKNPDITFTVFVSNGDFFSSGSSFDFKNLDAE